MWRPIFWQNLHTARSHNQTYSVAHMRNCENHKSYEDIVHKNSSITLNCVSSIYFSETVTFISNTFKTKFKVKIELVLLHISFEVKNCSKLFPHFQVQVCILFIFHTYSSDVLVFNIFCDIFEQKL